MELTPETFAPHPEYEHAIYPMVALVAVDREGADCDDPPREARLGDEIVAAPRESVETFGGDLRCHSTSYDCWHVLANGTRCRVVVVWEPYDRFQHGSDVTSYVPPIQRLSP